MHVVAFIMLASFSYPLFTSKPSSVISFAIPSPLSNIISYLCGLFSNSIVSEDPRILIWYSYLPVLCPE